MITVYRLKHKNSKRHYVGITSRSLDARLADHFRDKDSNKRTMWIKSHVNDMDLFYMEPITAVDNIEDAKRLEIFWIAEDRRVYGNEKIMNGTDGGDGTPGHIISEETRKLLSELKIGDRNPNFGKHHPPETIEKMSNSAIGRKPWIAGKNHSPETRAKISCSEIGKFVSKESRLKMSAAKTGRPSSRKGIKNKSEKSGMKIAEIKSKLNKEQIVEIMLMLKSGISQIKVAKLFHVSPATISNIINRKTKFYKTLLENI